MTDNYRLPEDIDVWDAENVFYLRAPRARLGKLLAHYELYQQIVDLPGAVVECGVYKGASLCRFAAFRDVLENEDSRRIYGFDAFGAFPTSGVKSEADKAFIDRFEAAGGGGISKEALEAALAAKGHGNVELVEGDVKETIPAFLSNAPHLRIALLHLDMDVYEPTRFAIDQFLPPHDAGRRDRFRRL